MARLPEQERNDLREAQRAWIKYRDLYARYLRGQNEDIPVRLVAADWILRDTASQADLLDSRPPYQSNFSEDFSICVELANGVTGDNLDCI